MINRKDIKIGDLVKNRISNDSSDLLYYGIVLKKDEAKGFYIHWFNYEDEPSTWWVRKNASWLVKA